MADEYTNQQKILIQRLNDSFRQSFAGGRVLLTPGVQELGSDSIPDLLGRIQTYPAAKFDSGNDPYGEHDFGSLEYMGTKYFWKIDYYDTNLEFHADNPADSSLTRRVMTIMRADEY